MLALKEGGVFLLDEISLADDSVLERLNRYKRRTGPGSDSLHKNIFLHFSIINFSLFLSLRIV